MNWLDIVLAIPLVWGLYKGFTKGLILEAATLVALGLGIYGAMRFSNFSAGFLKTQLGWSSTYLPVVSLAVTFLGIIILVYLIAKLIESAVKAAALGPFNKLAGAAFGVLKFALIFSVLIFIVKAVEKNIEVIPKEIKTASILFEPVASIAPMVIPGLDKSAD